ncbi:MAG: hypothetical protein FJ029_12915, partial [Actinobacteria bacterium]|nr:hypothetical protein [Actinomycetota bacterium]
MEGPPSGATLYLVPAVARSGRALAVLEVHPRPGLALEPATGDRLRALAKVVGATLELLLELGAARQRDDAWSAIVPAVRGLARATSTASVFATLGPVVRQQFNGGTLWLLVPQPACEDWTLWTEHAYAVAQANPSAAVPGVPRLAVTELEASLTGEIWIGNTEASELALAQLASGSGIGAMLGQRYTDGRSTLGFVLIGWRRAGEGAPEHAARLALLTDDIAAALLRIRESETQAADALRSDRLRLVGAMANGVAHGLNNAIGGIIGHADLAAMRDDLDQTRQDLAWIRGAAEQARHTLQRLRLAGAVMHPRELDVLDLNLVAIAAVSEFQAAWRRQPGVGAGSRLAVETDLRAARHVYGD